MPANASLTTPALKTLLQTQFGDRFCSDTPEDFEKYGQDWSGVVRPAPSLIVFPRSTEEVSRFLELCTENDVRVVPSGGRTGLSGGATAANGEVVLSLEKMNRIGQLDEKALTLEVEAGVITQAVHEHCEPHGLTWPVDFASKGSSQVGGNLSTNAGGVRVIRYGLTRNWVLGLTAVTMSGEILHLNGALEKNNTGPDLRQVFIGSEGTMGVITEALLKLSPVPNEAKTRVCFFALEKFSRVIELFGRARQAPFLLSAFECLSRECLDEVVRYGLKSPFAGGGHGRVYCLVEIEETTPGSADAFIEAAFESGLVLDGVQAQSPREKAELWALREQVAESILQGREVHQQDLSVPIPSLEGFASDIETRYAKAYPEFEVFIFGHIGDGNLHIFIRKPKEMESKTFHARCEESDEMLFALTQKFRGSISAEHGIGLLKKPALPYSRTPEEIVYLRGLKQAFDPKGLLNPGKIFETPRS